MNPAVELLCGPENIGISQVRNFEFSYIALLNFIGVALLCSKSLLGINELNSKMP
ncbi:hypothetical protein [Ferruginibacter sp. SUN106]|uniref:hypothetical protein n=1 Tax=Ferruginibacter sp. SUN106 TaxID=2978348 RepID=UPI003D361023